MITGQQLVAARELLGWSADMLAKRTDCSVKTVWAAEADQSQSQRATRMLARLQSTLEAAGIEFLDQEPPSVRIGKTPGG